MDFGDTDLRPKRHGWAPGGYVCTCYLCGKRFQGDKRASNCAPCAYAQPDRDPEALLTKFVPGPLSFHKEHPAAQGGPAIVDAKGSVVALLMWPGHAPADTEQAEQELCAIGRKMATVLGEW